MSKNNEIQEKFDVIVAKFGKLTAADLTAERKTELDSLFQEIGNEFYGHSSYFDSYVSGATEFFYSSKAVITKWAADDVFADREVLRVVALTALRLYVGSEHTRQHAFIDIPTWRTVHHTSGYWSAVSSISAGDFLLELGFYEEALSYYNGAKGYYDRETGAEGQIFDAKLKLAIAYRKSSQKSEKLDEFVSWMATEVVRNADWVISRYLYRHWRHETFSWKWDHPVENAKERLVELGFTGDAEQHELLLPLYKNVIGGLLYDHNCMNRYYAMGEVNRHNSEDLARVYRLVGDDENARKWELVTLEGQREYLERATSRRRAYVRRLKKERPDSVASAQDRQRKDLAELRQVKERIHVLQGWQAEVSDKEVQRS